MTDFMKDDFSDFFLDVFFLFADLLDGFLIDDDHIRREIAVKRPPVFKGDAVVSAQNLCEWGSAGVFIDIFSRFFFDDDSQIVEEFSEFFRYLRQGLFD